MVNNQEGGLAQPLRGLNPSHLTSKTPLGTASNNTISETDVIDNQKGGLATASNDQASNNTPEATSGTASTGMVTDTSLTDKSPLT